MVVLEVLEYDAFAHSHLLRDLVPDLWKVPGGQGDVVVNEFLVVFELHIFGRLQDAQYSFL